MTKNEIFSGVMLLPLIITTAMADESLLGRVKGSETLPQGTWELDQTFTYRTDKSVGHYEALDSKTEIEYGITNRLTAGGDIKMQALDTSGILINGYLPGAEKYSLKASGVEGSLKYNFLSPAKDDFGLSVYVSLAYDWLDPHSGKDKDKTSVELQLLTQKYFMDGQLVWMGNAGLETTYAKRIAINNLPTDFEWPTDPEMEIDLIFGTGLSYRFANNWFVGAEVICETEYETEIGQERYSWHAGPSLHYGGAYFWATATWLPQISGGGEQFAGQTDTDLHLIEKTKQEFILKFGIDF